MNGAALILGAVAILVLVAAVVLIGSASSRARSRATSAFVEQHLERFEVKQDPAAADLARYAASMDGKHAAIPGLRNLLLRAGIRSEQRFLLFSCGLLIILMGFAFWAGGVLSAIIMLVMYVALSWFRLWWLAERRARKMVKQIPAFIDALVRLVTIGSSLPSAFQEIVPQADPPLQEVLERAAQLTLAGVDLDVALRQIAKLYRLEELFLIAAVVGVSMRFGGRVDQVLERMAAFMRDLQQAREELVALSAEVRLSAWILALLPIGLAGFMVMFNHRLFVGMWNDATGKHLLVGAFALEVVGSFWLYRMAKSI